MNKKRLRIQGFPVWSSSYQVCNVFKTGSVEISSRGHHTNAYDYSVFYFHKL